MEEMRLPEKFRKILCDYEKRYGKDEGYYILLSIFSTAMRDSTKFGQVARYLDKIMDLAVAGKKLLVEGCRGLKYEERVLLNKLLALLPPRVREKVLECKKLGEWW